MKKGQSYIVITDKTHPKHKLVEALTKKGYVDFELIYASHMSTDAGWSCTKGTGIPLWLGFTISEALKQIANAPTLNATKS